MHSDCQCVITCYGVHCVCLGNGGATLNLFLMTPKLLSFLKSPELPLCTYFISDTSTSTKGVCFKSTIFLNSDMVILILKV